MNTYYDLIVNLLFDYIKIIFNRADKEKDFNDIGTLPDINDEILRIKDEARKIALSADKYNENSKDCNKLKPLETIFNVFRADSSKFQNKCFNIQYNKDSINFAEDVSDVNIKKEDYEKLCDYIKKNISKALENKSINNLISILEYSAAYVPCKSDAEDVYDISLFNNSKLAAAIAGCLYYSNLENSDNKFPYLLVSADVSGIQNFIYTISSKGALKSLRGRSFYLEIVMENIIDEILEKSRLSRINLLYSGGGHFYMLLPNTETVINILNDAKENINNWFIEKYGTKLYIELSYVKSDNNILCNSDKNNNLIGELYKSVGQKISKGKLQRYSNEQLVKLMFENKLENNLKDCAICHRSTKVNEETHFCENCTNIMKLGNMLPRINEKRSRLVISKEKNNNSLEIPSINNDSVYLYVEQNNSISDRKVVRKYSINNKECIENNTINLWCGIYSTASEEENRLITLEELALKSTGIRRLGVLRADVDNLGQAFISGFENSNDKEKYKYISLSRNCNLSYNLSQFFKYEINKICTGNIGFKQFKLINNSESKNEPKKVAIVYAGGDDLFIVGAWNEIIELAVDINNTLKKFTNNKMSLSAGVGLFHNKYPMNQMALKTGELEHSAKVNGKNRLSLFDYKVLNEGKDNIAYDTSNIYEWDEFQHKVCHDKLSKLYKWFDFDNTGNKMTVGMSLLYKLLMLVREIRKGNKINLARVAYSIGRIEPKDKSNEIIKQLYLEFKEEFYKWMLNKEDLRQVETALTLAVYLNREGEDIDGLC